MNQCKFGHELVFADYQHKFKKCPICDNQLNKTEVK